MVAVLAPSVTDGARLDVETDDTRNGEEHECVTDGGRGTVGGSSIRNARLAALLPEAEQYVAEREDRDLRAVTEDPSLLPLLGGVRHADAHEIARQWFVRTAAWDCRWCGDCGVDLKPDQQVWRVLIYYPRSGSAVAPVCEECAPTWRWQSSMPARACEWCDRPVVAWTPFHSDKTACCGHCLNQLNNRRRRDARAHDRADRVCETCEMTFTPPRADGRYCSNKCRQKAYRARSRGETRSE